MEQQLALRPGRVQDDMEWQRDVERFSFVAAGKVVLLSPEVLRAAALKCVDELATQDPSMVLADFRFRLRREKEQSGSTLVPLAIVPEHPETCGVRNMPTNEDGSGEDEESRESDKQWRWSNAMTVNCMNVCVALLSYGYLVCDLLSGSVGAGHYDVLDPEPIFELLDGAGGFTYADLRSVLSGLDPVPWRRVCASELVDRSKWFGLRIRGSAYRCFQDLRST